MTTQRNWSFYLHCVRTGVSAVTSFKQRFDEKT